MPRIYDVSLPVRDGGVTYPGNPPIRISYHQSLERGDGANVSEISFGSHTGTHVDAQLHFIAGGTPVDGIVLDRLVGKARVLEFGRDVRAIGAAELTRAGLADDRRVLLKTRNSAELLGRDTFDTSYTYLAPDGAELLCERGVDVVGIDYLSVEQFRSGHHRTHLTLLGRGVVIVEGLDLSGIPPGSYTFICLPLRLEGRDGAPARAILIEEND